MPDTTKASGDRSDFSHIAIFRRVGVTLAVMLLAAVTLLAGIGSDGGRPVTTDAQEISVSQTATCVEASNLTHVTEGRATRFLLWVWAEGSNNYLGWLWTSTSLREGPTGTWTMVPECDPSSTTSSSSSSSTSSSSSSTSSSTTSSSTTSSSTTSSTAPPPDGAAIYGARCAVCHGADGSGGAGPDLRGIGEVHTVEEIIAVVTNGRGAMPAWRDILTPAEIEAVSRYVASIPGDGGHGHHGHHSH